MRIDMLVYNRCTSDARVEKEATTLAGAGHRVRVIAVLDATTDREEERDGFRIVRIDRRPLHYRLLRAGRIAAGIGRRRLLGEGPEDGVEAGTGAGAGTGTGDGAGAGTGEHGGARRRALAAALAPVRLLAEALRRLLLLPHKPLMYVDWYWRAYRLVRADPPGALHAHDLNTLPVAAALARRLQVPLTYDAHELFPEISTLSRREAAVWRRLERRLAPRADRVLTVCDSIADELARRYGVRRPTVLLNCPAASANGTNPGGLGALVGHSPTKAPEGDEPAAERGGLSVHMTVNPPRAEDREPTVLYQGGFAPHRGLPTLVRAARSLERGAIVLMGWGRLEEELRALIAREGLAERVRIVPPVAPDEVVARAAEATIGVIPYEPVGLNNTYTTPNKLFDYMAAGLPIAASRLPELTRFVEGPGLGLTFTPGDPASLAATLNELLADRARLSAMAGRARKAAQHYTWENESRKLLEIYTGRSATS